MTKFLRTAATGVALAAAAASAPAFAQAQATADARAEILSALTLQVEAGSALDFGAVVITDNTVADTLVMGEDGVLTCGANFVCSGTTDVPVFDISGGSANRTVRVNLPSADVTTPLYIYLGGDNTITDETQRLELYDFTSDATFNAATTVNVLDPYGNVTGTQNIAAHYSVDLDAAGEASFTVGGTLGFDGDEVAGAYSGTFDVSVDYL